MEMLKERADKDPSTDTVQPEPGPSSHPPTAEAIVPAAVEASESPKPVVVVDRTNVRDYYSNAYRVGLTKPTLLYKVEFEPTVTSGEAAFLGGQLVRLLASASVQACYKTNELLTSEPVQSASYSIPASTGQLVTLKLIQQDSVNLADWGRHLFADLADKLAMNHGIKNTMFTKLNTTVHFASLNAEARAGFKTVFTFKDGKPATLRLQRHHILISKENIMQLWLRHRNDKPPLETFRRRMVGAIVLSKHNGKRYVVQHVYDTKEKTLRSDNFDGNSSIYAAIMAAAAEAGTVVEINNMAQPVMRAIELEGDQVVYLIPELVQQTDSWPDLEADKFGRARIVKGLAKPVATRYNEMDNYAKRNWQNEQTADTAVLGRWNVRIKKVPLLVEGISLPSLDVQLRNWTAHPNHRGEFGQELFSRRDELIDAPDIPQIIAIVPSLKRNEMDAYKTKIYALARLCKLTINSFIVATVVDLAEDNYLEVMQTQAAENKNVTLFLIALPDKYSFGLKLISYSRHTLKVAAVVIDSDDLKVKNRDARSKVTLTQIVAETQGTPWTVTIPVQDMQAVGVYSERCGRDTLFGAVTSSGDCLGTKIKTTVKGADRPETLSKIINDLVEQHMYVIAKADDEYRSKLIIYRLSGRTDFEVDEEAEIRAIQAGLFTHRGKESRPKLTYVRVDPHRSSEFFAGPSSDPHCGVIFPDTLRQNSLHSFHMAGSDIPHMTFAHFAVILDENELSADDLYQTTHTLCCLSFDCHEVNSVPSFCEDARNECDLVRD